MTDTEIAAHVFATAIASAERRAAALAGVARCPECGSTDGRHAMYCETSIATCPHVTRDAAWVAIVQRAWWQFGPAATGESWGRDFDDARSAAEDRAFARRYQGRPVPGEVAREPRPRPAAALRCAMPNCRGVVTHIDEKGWTYCAGHGADRRSHCRCRKLRPVEVRTLTAGGTIHYARRRVAAHGVA